MQINTVSAGQGASWFGCGWSLFKRDFGTWFIMFLIFIAIFIVLSLIPFLGGITLAIVSPALVGGFMYAASEQDKGNAIEVGYLFQGFRDKERMNKLLVLGGIYLLTQIVFMFIMMAMIGSSVLMSQPEGGAMDPSAMLTTGFVISMLLALALGFAISLGFIYAIPLIMLDNTGTISSIKMSFAAGLKNILALFVFGLIYLVLAVAAAIPFGLGFLILIPVSITAMYCSYKSIFH